MSGEEKVTIPSREELLNTEEQEEVGYSATEQEAIKHGWNPEGVEGKKNLTAEEFMDRQTLYDDIRSLKRQVRQQKDALTKMTEHHAKVKELERKKVIEELKLQKKAALEEGNYDAVVEIDEQMSEQKNAAKSEQTASQTNEAFEEWVKDNDWYLEDKRMRRYADTFGAEYAQEHPGVDLSEVYEAVSEEIKTVFQNKFNNTAREEPPKVEGRKPQSSGKSKSKVSVSDLTQEERDIMKTLVRSGALTEEQYLKEYAELKAAGL